ncbi:MAG: Predicted permease, cadmium resistance protein [uncultured Paraburkholderia sp.]|nr:MAG: Predicted permease, cadmium resistance protein [uncultured Paraburkholderia sp.]CAH2944711.1 MAG: Predicted permease, cadmium resistance protein [uncultured Paraburkholderia sp.]
MLSLALLAIAAYAATNIDNLFVLLAFLADAPSSGDLWAIRGFTDVDRGIDAVCCRAEAIAVGLYRLARRVAIGVGAMKL